MMPEFLERFRTELETYRLDYIKIAARPLVENEILPLYSSKFLGKPFLPVGMPYPCDKNGDPMILIAQINFAEMPVLKGYPHEGILQLFLAAKNWYEGDDYKILFHSDVQCEAQNSFDFITEDLYGESPVHTEHSLSFSRETTYGGAEDCRFKVSFDGKDYYDYSETLSEELRQQFDSMFSSNGHKIGGYADFTQYDPREDNEHPQDELLVLQIDTDEQIMFGDSGVAHIFLNRENLERKDFSGAYFHWDCC